MDSSRGWRPADPAPVGTTASATEWPPAAGLAFATGLIVGFADAMGQHVKVQELPGIGTRYDLAGGRVPQRVSVVVHKDGHRELYVFETASTDPTAVVELSADQARLLGAVLNGSYVVD